MIKVAQDQKGVLLQAISPDIPRTGALVGLGHHLAAVASSYSPQRHSRLHTSAGRRHATRAHAVPIRQVLGACAGTVAEMGRRDPPGRVPRRASRAALRWHVSRRRWARRGSSPWVARRTIPPAGGTRARSAHGWGCGTPEMRTVRVVLTPTRRGERTGQSPRAHGRAQ